MSSETTPVTAPAACDQCGHDTFTRKEGSLGSFWRRRSLHLVMFFCNRCSRAVVYRRGPWSFAPPRREDGAVL